MAHDEETRETHQTPGQALNRADTHNCYLITFNGVAVVVETSDKAPLGHGQEVEEWVDGEYSAVGPILMLDSTSKPAEADGDSEGGRGGRGCGGGRC